MSAALTNLLLMVVIISSFATACGGRDRAEIEVAKSSGSADALGIAEVPCTKGSCPSVPVYIDGPSGSSQVIANLAEDNVMNFSAKAERSSSRQIKLRVYYGPDQCKNKWAGQDSDQVSCAWRPTDVQQAGKVKAIARDVSYCLEKLNQNSQCTDMTKSIPEFDKEQEFSYTVEDNRPQQIDPAFIDNPGGQFGADSGIRGCGMGMLSGAIGVLTGSFMPAIMGCVKGYVGGLQQTQPYPQNNGGTVIGGTTTNTSNTGNAPANNGAAKTGF